ncbi:MAG: sensory rhodopsin transducer [Bradymonadaceae bacterium]|nr:sensory rhodopsin transducer [Lujinxingiaceae bacterium]
MTKIIGRTSWAIVGGNIALDQSGPEPDFTSRDSLSMLNLGAEDAQVEITIFYVDREPVGPYKLALAARRVREVRFNDLIDPEAIPLCTHYAALVEANVPIVVLFSRVDTRQAENARTASMAFPGE